MPPVRCRRQKERPNTSGVVLDGQVADNDARRRLCPVSQYMVVASHHFLRFVKQMQASWASQFGWSRPPSRPLRMASAPLGDFAAAVTACNIGDVGGSRRRTVVLTRGVGGAGGSACGVFGGWLGRACAAFSSRGFTGGGCWGLERVGKCGNKVGLAALWPFGQL